MVKNQKEYIGLEQKPKDLIKQVDIIGCKHDDGDDDDNEGNDNNDDDRDAVTDTIEELNVMKKNVTTTEEQL